MLEFEHLPLWTFYQITMYFYTQIFRPRCFSVVWHWLYFFNVGIYCGVHLFDHPLGSKFNHQLHITLYNFSKFLHVSWWLSMVSFHVLHLHLSFWLVGTTKYNIIEKNLTLSGIWTHDLLSRSVWSRWHTNVPLFWLVTFLILNFWWLTHLLDIQQCK